MREVAKYYPETKETPTGHLNQTRKNVESTKPFKKEQRRLDAARKEAVATRAQRRVSDSKATADKATTTLDQANLVFEKLNEAQLKGEKIKDVYTRVYDARETMFSDQT